MLKKFTKFYKRQQFMPNWASIFINPFYFSRKGLHQGIQQYAEELNGRLLDFGCGRKPFRELFVVNEYVGLDTEDSGHPHLREEREVVDVFYDGKKIPFGENTFDSVFSSEVFEHIFDLEDSLEEIHRVLRPEGMLLVTMPFCWDEHETPYDYGRLSSFGINYLLEKKGFEVIAVDKTSNFVEVLFQMFNLYIYRLTHTRYKYVNVLLHFLFISPFTVAGMFWSWILPKRYTLYLNNVVLAKKK